MGVLGFFNYKTINSFISVYVGYFKIRMVHKLVIQGFLLDKGVVLEKNSYLSKNWILIPQEYILLLAVYG